MPPDRPRALHTLAVERRAPQPGRRPVVPPIVQSATFEAASVKEMAATAGGDTDYSRLGNPTLTEVEGVLARLEGADAALVLSSGMAAIASTLLALVRAGDHMVAQRPLFYGTYALLRDWLPRLGIDVTLVDNPTPQAMSAALRPASRLLYVETPTNPRLDLVDLDGVAGVARAAGISSVVDNTFASPVNQQPLAHGIDLVVHSATKYLAGHSDVVCGAVAGSAATIHNIRQARTAFGGILDPHAAWLLLRGLRTVAVRVEHQTTTALRLARFLLLHPGVVQVHYPFLESHPAYDLAQRQMRGGGGMVSFRPAGGRAAATTIVESLRVARLAGSLGGVETVVSLPYVSFGTSLAEDERKAMGLSDDLVRVSVGIEDAGDLVADFADALASVSAVTGA